jgi:hypothetical protein
MITSHRFLRPLLSVLVVFVVCTDVNAGDPKVLPVWPDKAPGETKELPPEGEVTEGGPKMVAGKRIYLVTNVSKPELAIYKPEPAKDTGA